MKEIIKQTIKDKLNTGETPAIDFRTHLDNMGHIQFNRNEWAIFFNSKCVHVSKTLDPVIKKLNKLNVSQFDLELNEFI